MRKGMLFFSQYRTLRRIFLKNLKKIPAICRTISPRSVFSAGWSPSAYGLAPALQRRMRTGIGRHRQRRARRTGAAADSGGPICATDAAEYGPEVSNAHLAFGSRRSFAGTGVCCFTGAGVCCGPLLVCRDGCTLFCPTGPSLFCGVDARRFAGANAHCFVGPGALTGIFRTFVPEAVPCFWRRTR